MEYIQLVEELPTVDLVSIYNYLTEGSIKKFRDRTTAEKRAREEILIHQISLESIRDEIKISEGGLDVIREIIFERPDPVVEEAPKVDAVANKSPKDRKKGAHGNRYGGKRLYQISKRGMRETSRRYQNYLKITDGMTYEEYRGIGGDMNDLSVMIRHDMVRAE